MRNKVNPRIGILSIAALAASLAVSAVPTTGQADDAIEQLAREIARQQRELEALIAKASARITPQAAVAIDSGEALGEFLKLVAAGGSLIDDNQQTRVRRALITGPLARLTVISDLDYGQMIDLRNALAVLGVSEYEHELHDPLLRLWVEHSEHRDRLTAAHASDLVYRYRAMMEREAQLREGVSRSELLAQDPLYAQLVDQIHWRFFTRVPDDPQALEHVRHIAWSLQESFSDEQRATAREHLVGAYLANDAVLRSMGAGHFREALVISSILELPSAQQFDAAIRFVQQNQKLDQHLPLDVMFLLDLLGQAPQEDTDVGRSAAAAQQALVATVPDRLAQLDDPSLDHPQQIHLIMLARKAYDAANEAHRSELAQALMNVALSAQSIDLVSGPLSPFFRTNLHAMGEQELLQTVVIRHIENSPAWRLSQGGPLASLYSQLTPAHDDRARAAQQQVLDEASTDLPRMLAFMGGVRHEADRSEALLNHVQQRINGFIQSEQQISTDTLGELAEVAPSFFGADRGRQLLLDVLQTHLSRGGELVGEFQAFNQLATIAADLNLTDELRQLVVTPEGYIRLDVAKLMAWSYSDNHAMHGWRSYLQEAIDESTLEGDALAHWLLARAYAAMVPPAELSSVVGLQWIERAFAEAQSETLRLDTLDWLIERRLAAHDFQTAINLIESVAHQFETDEAQARLKELSDLAHRRFGAVEARRERIARQREIRRLDAQIGIMHRRLAAAREAGRSAADIASIERMISGLQENLRELRSAP